MNRELRIAPPDVCLQVYYEASMGEVGSTEIKKLFGGNISPSSICNIKKKVQKKMIEKDVVRIDSNKVNIDVLFEVLGLKLDALENRYKNLIRLRKNHGGQNHETRKAPHGEAEEVIIGTQAEPG